MSLLSGTLSPCTKAPTASHELGVTVEPDRGPVYSNELDLAEVRAPGVGSTGSTGSMSRGHAVQLLTLGSSCIAQLCPWAM